MNEHNNYIEIGRGAKLTPMKYWHQYVLGIDLTETLKFLVVSEVGKNEILYRNNITLEEIHSHQWREFLKISQTKTFVERLIEISSDKKKLFDELDAILKSIESTKQQLNGNWISEKEYSNLNYNSNFGNWIDAVPTKGKLKFILDLESDNKANCHIKIPLNFWSGEKGDYSIQMGRFELSKTQILIWQNGIFPSQIKYKLTENSLALRLYNSYITFIKE